MGRGRTRAFTLVELLVVIAIVAVLIAMLMAAYSGIELAKRKTHCQRNLEEIGKAFNGYAARSDGWYPSPTDHYYGGHFLGSVDHEDPAQMSMLRKDPWSVLGHVQLLMAAGASAEIFWCPFSPQFGDWGDWPCSTWDSPFILTWGNENSARVYTGYTLFINRQSRFRDGRSPATGDTADNDIPLAADTLHYRSSGSFTHGWHHGGGTVAGLFNSDCNTLLKSGAVVFTSAGEMDWENPTFTIGSARDHYWCYLRD